MPLVMDNKKIPLLMDNQRK